MCAAVLSAENLESAREQLRPLRLPGQIKLHWTDESAKRRRRIVDAVAELDAVDIVISHLGERRRATERYRRKCLEAIYYELTAIGVSDATLESRSIDQDKRDRAHLVNLRSAGLARELATQHRRGGDEPLLGIPDIVLGALNAVSRGDRSYFSVIEESIVLHSHTTDSIRSIAHDERP